MKIYFLSSRPCELTLNGLFYGITDLFERFIEADLAERIFAKFTPAGELPLGFFLDESLLSSPPEGVEVYLLKDGVALYAKDFPPADCTLHPIAQARFGETLVSVFRQGAVQLSLQTEQNFFISTLPPSFRTCTLSYHAGFFLLDGENCLAIYQKNGKCVFLEQILAYKVQDNQLNATLPLSDSLGRVAECVYTLCEKGCILTQRILRQARSFNGDSSPQNLQEELIPYAFFESVLLGADYASFLSEELLPVADRIAGFLGDFEKITLTPNPNTVGLVKRRGERLFEIFYYTAVVQNGKIIDITG